MVDLKKKKVALFCFFIYYFLVNCRFYQLLSRFSVKDSTGSALYFCVFPFFPAQSLSPCNGKSPHVWKLVPYAVETPKLCFFFYVFLFTLTQPIKNTLKRNSNNHGIIEAQRICWLFFFVLTAQLCSFPLFSF